MLYVHRNRRFIRDGSPGQRETETETEREREIETGSETETETETETGSDTERVKARPRIPPEKDWRDRGPPPERWKC